ncbi:hypothetical protein CUT44_09750 [Streptomyces carminius]|uniref:HTH cro/C1-type domain-containing protein n=1 Tax=Streptomyces carminius TaxID=2665496 RepID=A0A2M8M183_9ACTN|nr:hypothetical protein CUT44_09750 [Streptomyces carminius]
MTVRHPPPPAGLGPLLRGARTAAGLTQRELAASSGISTRSVSELESGRNRGPQQSTVEALADALGVSPRLRAELHRTATAGRGGRLPPSPLRPRTSPDADRSWPPCARWPRRRPAVRGPPPVSPSSPGSRGWGRPRWRSGSRRSAPTTSPTAGSTSPWAVPAHGRCAPEPPSPGCCRPWASPPPGSRPTPRSAVISTGR